jgi:hypothetical protein
MGCVVPQPIAGEASLSIHSVVKLPFARHRLVGNRSLVYHSHLQYYANDEWPYTPHGPPRIHETRRGNNIVPMLPPLGNLEGSPRPPRRDGTQTSQASRKS